MKKIYCLLLSLCCSYATIAQRDSIRLVSLDVKEVIIDSFVEQLERQTGLHFYYNPDQFDSLRITMQVEKERLEKVLEKAFFNTDYLFSFDENKIVYLTKGKRIITELGTGFFDKQNRSTNELTKIDTLFIADDKNVQRIGVTATDRRVYEIGDKRVKTGAGTAILAGYITDAKTGEPVAGASVSVEGSTTGISTDQYGYFALTLPKGRNVLLVQGIGIRDIRRQIHLFNDGKINIEAEKQVMVLRNVVINSQKLNSIRSTQLGVQKMDIRTIRQVPVVFGETDVLKVMLSLPGVKTVGEASTGLNVRGGSVDQNLILFNDATVFNPSHFFGMFSAFNPEIVKDVELFKSSMPARYGGRLSSVVNITSREGNKKKISGVAGIGVLTSRLVVEGPLVKDKTSFIVGGRTTYANWLLNLLPKQYKKSRASFYDLNLHIAHQVNKNNNLYFTGYFSRDRFNLNNDTTYGYGNMNFSVKWKSVLTNKLTATFIGGYDKYNYDISSPTPVFAGYKLKFDLGQAYLKAQFNYFVDNRHSVEFGLNTLRYKLNPGSYLPFDKESVVAFDKIAAEQALESAVFLSDRYTVNQNVSIEGGLRFSVFNYLGPQQVNTYPRNVPKTLDNVIETVDYKKGKFIQTYAAPEARLSIRYAFNDSFSVKMGYNTQQQYIHLLSNTTAMAPTDIWKLSDPNIKPQSGDQVSVGLYRNFKSNTIETSIEVYYKRMKNFLDFRSGADLVMNHHIETDVIGTRGRAYGVELLVKKLTGRLNGWISYTWSRTWLKMNDPTAGEIINGGKEYPANYDKPHDITVIGNYRVNNRLSFSLNTTYSTGRPFTLPIGRFYYNGAPRTLYAGRNAYRIPDYFRADFSLNIEGNHKTTQKTHNSWTIGVYNLTGRRNAYSVYYVSENRVINGYKLSIFGSAIPYINFNIRF